MIPLNHDQEPQELIDFNKYNQIINVANFDSLSFSPIKSLIRKQLYDLQDKQCVYCERTFKNLNEMQVEHIKPKSGKFAHPNLCFTYTNYAASCIQNTGKGTRTCGQNKADKILTIEPTSLNCNDSFVLNTEGEIHPLSNSTKKVRHSINCTPLILGLNKAHLVLLRKKKIKNLMGIIKLKPELARKFMASGDFRFIMLQLTK